MDTDALNPPTATRDARARFEALLAAHRGAVRKVAASYATDAADREDLAQEIALALWHAWPRYDPARSALTWLYRVALNVAITHRRRERLRRHDPLDPAEDAIGDHDVDAEGRQALARVIAAMSTLGPLDRALLLLHLDGLSHRAVGEVLGISESNAATRLSRIRERLRRDSGITEEGADR